MKKIIAIMSIILFSSCSTMEDEMKYNKERWKYKTKELELDYLMKLNSVKSDAELKRTIMYLDSLNSTHKL